MLNCFLGLSSNSNNNPRSVFCKSIQYIFDGTKDYVEKEKIKDLSGSDFILPTFRYHTDSFTNIPTNHH